MSHSRTASLSEFIHFLFRAQLVDHDTLQIEKDHPELQGETGMQLKTFRESSTPVDDEFDEYEDQFLGASYSSDMNGSFDMGYSPQPQRAHRAGRGHTRRTSSIFDTSRFAASASASSSSDRTSFVSSPTSTTPSSPTMNSASSASGHGWRIYGGQAIGRQSTESTRTTSTS